MGTNQYKGFWYARSIVGLIGIDYFILQKTNNDNIIKFYLSGFFVVLIMIVSFLSVFYAFELMFRMWYAEVLLSVFFSMMFFVIYIFLIQTFSKQALPAAKLLYLPNISRICFVLLIGYLIAQPIKIFIQRDAINHDISAYKEELYEEFSRENVKVYQADLSALAKQYGYYKSLTKNQIIDEKLLTISNQIRDIDIMIVKANDNARTKIQSSNFVIKRIGFAQKYPVTNCITLIVLVIFCMPVALIYSISKDSQYYIMKKNHDKEIIDAYYEIFKSQYRTLFKKYGLNEMSFYEPFLDPPYNQIKKRRNASKTQMDFFNNLFR